MTGIIKKNASGYVQWDTRECQSAAVLQVDPEFDDDILIDDAELFWKDSMGCCDGVDSVAALNFIDIEHDSDLTICD
ncbi:hypothetical protein CYMTET_20384 [Cymbomonas tetramitiformis]|uniref:Uncharacterized protein n=1 Tax=Cymbomonas tetramitiformis TaxID=36881 RepID=A0AAE0G4C1_9CHLO|nr:hypothetical protein CYMTET_20384 [Cymbomonas tetramitiformis]